MDDSTLQALVIDAIRDPILVVDATGEVLLANPAAIRLLELTRGGTGAGPRGLDAAAIMDLVRRAERGRGPLTESAHEHGVAIDVEPLADEDGERRWLLRVRAPDALAGEVVAERAVADIAHEIKNPITAMMNALGALPLPDGDESTAAAQAARMARGAFERSVRRLGRLVNGLLDLSRMRAGALQLNRGPIDAREFVCRVVSDFRALHPAACERIDCVVQDDTRSAYIDPDRIEQAIWNLLANAVRYTPPTGSVRVRASLAGVESVDDGLRLVPWDMIGHPRLLRIDVEDSGLGMTSETLAHLFDRHHDSSESAHLGLNITRALVDAHDGWMQVESRLGEGTLVTVLLPEDAPAAGLLSRVRRAQREARRRMLAHRPTAVAVLGKDAGVEWKEMLGAWPGTPRLDARDDATPRDAAVWPLTDAIAVALLPLHDADGDPAGAIGSPLATPDEGAWVMEGFVAGWCRDREQVSFAQAFHRAAARMSRALGVAGGTGSAAAMSAAESVEAGEPAVDA